MKLMMHLIDVKGNIVLIDEITNNVGSVKKIIKPLEFIETTIEDLQKGDTFTVYNAESKPISYNFSYVFVLASDIVNENGYLYMDIYRKKRIITRLKEDSTWEVINGLMDLKAGDTFRMHEPDDYSAVVSGGKDTYTVKVDPYISKEDGEVSITVE